MTGFWNNHRGIFVPLLTLAAIELLAHTPFRIPNPPPILMLAIIASTYLGGTRHGLACAAIVWLYCLHFFSLPGHPLRYADEDFQRIVVLTFAIPATAILVGILKRKADRSDEIANGKALLEEEIAERRRAENLISARLHLSQFALSHSLEELLQATLDEVEKLTDSQIGFYHFLEADQRTLSLQAWSTRTLREMCTAEGKGRHYDINDAGVWVDCVRERRPVIHNAYAALPHKKGLPPGHATVVRELVVPIFRGDRIVAILGVGNKASDYDESDVGVVALLADMAWDIAEGKEAEEALKRSDERFQAFMRNFPGLAYMKDGDGRVLFANEGFGRFLGLDPAAMPGKTNYDLFPAEFAEKITRDDRQIIESGRDESLEESFAGRHWLTYKFPIPQPGATPLLGGLTIDLTEHRKAEDARREAQERAGSLAGILENSLNEIYVFDAGTLRFIEANKGARMNVGYTIEELRALTPLDLKPEFTPDSFARMIAPLKSGEQQLLRFTTVLRRKDGSRYPVDVHLQLSSFAAVPVFVAIILDVTERRKAEEELRVYREHLEDAVRERTGALEAANARLKELDRLKSMFIASMSHELRTPLNSVIGFSSILIDEWCGPLNDEQKKNLASVKRSGMHLLALINDIIDVSKVEAGTIEIAPTDFDLRDLLAEAVEMFKKEVADKGLALRLDAPHLPLRTERRRLLQCVVNLVGNAVKFTERGGIGIVVTPSPCPLPPGEGTTIPSPLPPGEGRGEGGTVLPGVEDYYGMVNDIEIAVQDTGIGIREEDRPQLFQSFVRLDSPLQGTVPGTGLGLYLTKKIVTEILKGEIRVESAYGKGSRFVLRIPKNIEAPSPQPSPGGRGRGEGSEDAP